MGHAIVSKLTELAMASIAAGRTDLVVYLHPSDADSLATDHVDRIGEVCVRRCEFVTPGSGWYIDRLIQQKKGLPVGVGSLVEF